MHDNRNNALNGKDNIVKEFDFHDNDDDNYDM